MFTRAGLAAFTAWCCALPATTTPEQGWKIVRTLNYGYWNSIGAEAPEGR